jgi:hypothetical protein
MNILRPERVFAMGEVAKGKYGQQEMREALLFSGLRRPSVRVVERQKVFGRHGSGFVDEAGESPAAVALVVETTGNGRAYEVKHAEGWWRDFAEVRIDDARTVVRFLQMRGDPFGRLETGRPISTADWATLIRQLRQAATAWESVAEGETVGDTGGDVPLEQMIGRATRDPDSAQMKVSAFRAEQGGAAGFLRPLPPEWMGQLSVTYDGLQPVLIAKSLAVYLCAAAAASLRAGLPMRRCDYCSSWFTLHYANARQCSASCRAARFNNRRSPHGFVPQDHDPQGSNPVAEPVASAGNKRQPAGSRAKLLDSKGSGRTRGANAGDRKPGRRRPQPA